MGEVVNAVSEATDNEAILVTDVGQNQMLACRYFKFAKKRSVVTSGGMVKKTTILSNLSVHHSQNLLPCRHYIYYLPNLQESIRGLRLFYFYIVPLYVLFLNRNLYPMHQLIFPYQYD